MLKLTLEYLIFNSMGIKLEYSNIKWRKYPTLQRKKYNEMETISGKRKETVIRLTKPHL